MTLFWHRRDLRVSDNRGLAAAAEAAAPVVPVFVFDDAVLEHGSDARLRFVLDSLAEFRGVDADDIHDWPELSEEDRAELAPDYPAPIVDHGERREQALAMFKRARGEEPEDN